MRWGVLVAAAALAAAPNAPGGTPERVDCGAQVAPWRLTTPHGLKQHTCRTVLGLHGGTIRTTVRRGSRVVLVLEASQWYPPPGPPHAPDTPLPLEPRSQSFWHSGARIRLRVLDRSADVRGVVRSLRFLY